jgi:hypothetical protein
MNADSNPEDHGFRIRCAHKPTGPGQLDACDRWLQVIDESFDCAHGQDGNVFPLYFEKYWQAIPKRW